MEYFSESCSASKEGNPLYDYFGKKTVDAWLYRQLDEAIKTEGIRLPEDQLREDLRIVYRAADLNPPSERRIFREPSPQSAYLQAIKRENAARLAGLRPLDEVSMHISQRVYRNVDDDMLQRMHLGDIRFYKYRTLKQSSTNVAGIIFHSAREGVKNPLDFVGMIGSPHTQLSMALPDFLRRHLPLRLKMQIDFTAFDAFLRLGCGFSHLYFGADYFVASERPVFFLATPDIISPQQLSIKWEDGFMTQWNLKEDGPIKTF